MGPENRTANRELHAAGFSGVERLDDPRRVFPGPGPSRVLNRDLHLAGIGVPGADDQFPRRLTHTADSIDSIHSARLVSEGRGPSQ